MIETRYLHYFLAIAREQNITRAAQSLHVSQPTLSKQMMDLEEMLGCQLFIRSSRKIELTDEGLFFRARAEELLDLMNKTETTLQNLSQEISGDIYFGGGETYGMNFIISCYKELKQKYPSIRLNLFSSDADSLLEKLDNGLLDFALLIGPRKLDKYDYLKLDYQDSLGILMPKDDPLAKNETIDVSLLENLPIYISKRTWAGNQTMNWNGFDYKVLNVVGTFNLIYNATFLVEQGLGYALTIDRLVDYSDRNLTFRKIKPDITSDLFVVTKKYQTFSPAGKVFLNYLTEKLNSQ